MPDLALGRLVPEDAADDAARRAIIQRHEIPLPIRPSFPPPQPQRHGLGRRLSGSRIYRTITRPETCPILCHSFRLQRHFTNLFNSPLRCGCIYEAYFSHMGEDSRANPFARLNFPQRKKRSRPPFPTEWITGRILKPGALATLNEEARGIVLAMIETGARPSELANLAETSIRLSHKVPHLSIEPRDDPDDPREIKTASSERLMPLVGVARAVFERHGKGFPRYRNRENDLSAALNKFFKTHKLFPSGGHKIYSFRHSFEDRMKEAGLDEELRRILMGHTIDRPRYGAGGSLEWRRDELMKVALPFDPGIV